MTDSSVASSRGGPSPGPAHTALALGGFAIGTAEFAAMSFLPALGEGFGIDAPTAGHAISAYALGVVVGAPLLAVAGARLNRRALLVVLMVWFGLGNLISATAPDFGSLLLLRFLTAVPHGAYFGIAALVAVGMVPPDQRGAAIGRVLTGLTVATIVGVPLANLVAQGLGWRYGFGIIGLLSLLVATLLFRLVPAQARVEGASALRELGALRRGQVWLTLGIGAVGFGGMFAVYTYLASTLTLVTGAPEWGVPLVLAVFGIGLTAGNILAPRLMQRSTMTAIGMVLAWSAAALAIYPSSVGSLPAITVAVFLVALGGALGTVLQARLMDVAGDAQGLAAALNHSAFNFANALGPWLGGLAINAGYGWASTGWVGCGLALGGLVVWGVSRQFEGREACPAES